MQKEALKNSQHLVNLMLDREIKHDKTRFADIDINELKDKIKTKQMLNFLEKKSADTNRLKEQIKV